MKHTTRPLVALLAALVFTPGPSHAQQALKTDNAGNPVTPLNLGGGNITGTLPAARLPAGIGGAPVVQTIAQAQGDIPLTAGTNVAVLTVPLTGPLNLRLPAASSYAAGRLLVVIDPGGFSDANHPVQVQPAGSDLLNGSAASAGATTVLAGIGAATFYPDGSGRWAAGQSYLHAPTSAGLTLAGPAVSGDATALSVHDGNEQEIFAVRGDGTASALYLDAANALSSDTGSIYSDGAGGLTVDHLAGSFSTSDFLELRTVDPDTISNPFHVARLYYGQDGALHVRTPDHVDHLVTWTTAP